jgi:polyisoprenoid-binding protein YceI
MASPAAACALPPLAPGAAPRPVYRLDPRASQVGFEAQAFLHRFGGQTSKLQGLFRGADLTRFSDAEACIQIDAASLETGNNLRDRTMREDHLETAVFPTIDFRLEGVDSVRPLGSAREVTIRGALTLHGVTRELGFPVRVLEEGAVVRLEGETPLRMTDYGIPIPGFLFLTVNDQVTVRFQVTARREP